MRDQILNYMQKSFPLTKKPFLDMAEHFGISEEEVIDIIKKEKQNKIIRQTSAIFDTKRLGFESSLVAFKVNENDIENVAKIINEHPGVSHNYERDHEFNLWFTLAVPPNSKYSLDQTLQILAKKTSVKDWITLPTLKMFKISVKLDMSGKEDKKEKVAKKSFKKMDLNDFHHKVVKHAGKDIDIAKEPFKKAIQEIGCGYDEFFDTLSQMKEAGVMRRFASILNHRRAGFNANAMVVWDIDEKNGDEIGKKVAAFSNVSHCYLRPKYENWKYNLFSMIHGKNDEETQDVIQKIASEIEFSSYRPLYSLREFKKVRIKYFSPEFEEWENKNA